MKTLILLVLAVAVFGGVSDRLAHIAESEYGKTVIQSIQLTLNQDPASFGKVVDLLQALKSGIVNDQQEDAGFLNLRLEQCQSNSEAAQVQISASAARKASAEEALPLIEQALSDKRTQAADKEGEEQRNIDRIVALTNAREETRKQYQAKRDELTTLVSALNEAKGLIAQLKSTPQQAFVQLKHFREYISTQRQRTFHTAIHSILAMLESSSSEGSVEKVIAIIDNLVDAIYLVQKQEMIADDEREADFVKQKIRFEFANTRLATKVAELRAEVLASEQKALELRNEISTHADIVSIKSKELADWTKTCADATSSLEQLNATRNDQLAVIEECLQLLAPHSEEVVELLQSLKL